MTLPFSRALRAFVFVMAAAPLAAAQPADTLVLSLGDAARMAAARNAAVVVARTQVGQREAREAQARAALYPRLSADLSEAGRTFNTATLGLDLPSVPGQPPIFDPDGEIAGPVITTDLRARLSADVLDLAARRRVASARAGVVAARAEVDAVAERAAAQAAAAYVAAAAAKAALDARAADRALAEDLLRIARAQLGAGVGVGIDVTRAEARLAAITAQTVAARGRWEGARLDLLRALGLAPATPIAVQFEGEAGTLPAPADTTALLRRAVAGRADLEAAQARLTALDAQLDAIRAERYPTVGLAASDGFIGKTPAHPLNTYDFGLRVAVPLFDGRRRSARVAEQEALRGELEARRDDLLEGVRFDIQRALLDLGTSAEQVEAARLRLALAEEEIAQATQRFQAGVAGNADVVSASLSLGDARDQLIAAQTAARAARVRLAAAVGTLTTLP